MFHYPRQYDSIAFSGKNFLAEVSNQTQLSVPVARDRPAQ
jgi:hypothetical protein